MRRKDAVAAPRFAGTTARKLAARILFLALCFDTFTAAFAQNYPNRAVRIVVPRAAGGGMDSVTRALSARLSEAFGVTFVVYNRPGAGSQIAMEIMSAAAPDGYTLMMISATTVVHPLLYKLRFDIVRDFTPLSKVTAQGYVLVVHPSITANTVAEFVQHLKANPDKVNFSSSGIGTRFRWPNA